MLFKGNIIITDPCYIIKARTHGKADDWEACGYGEDMAALGLKTFQVRDTIYGDWSCTTFELKEPLGNRKPSALKDADIQSILGKFCADAGEVGIFLLDEVLSYNPDFDYHLNRKWTTTLIENFDGNIIFIVDKGELFVVGTGNINFVTRQTGL